MDSKQTDCPQRTVEVQVQGLGAGLQLVLSQVGTGTRGKKHSPAGRHPPPPVWKKIGEIPCL